MANTPRLLLPLPDVSQADKTDVIGRDLEALEGLLGRWAKSRTTTAQPGSPTEGDVYILTASPTGAAWAGQGLKIARFRAGAWTFYTPVVGLEYTIQDETLAIGYWNGSSWATRSFSGIGSVSADATPTLGGDLNGAGHGYFNLRVKTVEIPDSGSPYVWAGDNDHLMTGTGSRAFTLPKASAQGSHFAAMVDTSTGELVFTPESGATLESAALGGSISSCRTAGQNRVAMLKVKRNTLGNNAKWVVLADHIA